MDIIRRFLNGEWFNKANEALNDPEKMKHILEKLKKIISKDGLKSVKDNLILMYDYVKCIINGSYTDYNGKDLIIIIAAIIYTVSPLDIIPDFLPVGFIDDVAVIGYALNSVDNELQKFKSWKISHC